MNTRKIMAAALRGRANYTLPMSVELAAAIDPTTTEEAILKVALDASDPKSFMLDLAEYFDEPVPVAAGVALSAEPPETPALVAGTEPEPPTDGRDAAEPTIRLLEDWEIIQEGDEWRLRDGLRHRDGREVMWRPVGDSVGKTPDGYSDSIFRRKA